MAQELWRKSALELAADIRTKKVSSREVVDAHLERIAQVHENVMVFRIHIGCMPKMFH